MAATIRLARHGAKKRPFYRIVVADRRNARDGRKIEQVGLYDPRAEPQRIEFETERLAKWLERGAKPSLTVSQLIKRSGIVLPADAAHASQPQSEAKPAE
jgi:small subunit ribosomal protein S16